MSTNKNYEESFTGLIIKIKIIFIAKVDMQENVQICTVSLFLVSMHGTFPKITYTYTLDLLTE